jgi:hypothetical protein
MFMIDYDVVKINGKKFEVISMVKFRRLVEEANGTDVASSRIYYKLYSDNPHERLIEGVHVFTDLHIHYKDAYKALIKAGNRSSSVRKVLTKEGVKKVCKDLNIDETTLLSMKNLGKLYGPKQLRLFDMQKKSETKKPREDKAVVMNEEFNIKIHNPYKRKGKTLISFNKSLREYLFKAIPDIEKLEMDVTILKNKILFEFVNDDDSYTIYTSNGSKLALINNSRTAELRKELKRKNLSEKVLTDIRVYPDSKTVIAYF